MYKIENGVLVENGKRVLALGQSYYPSFHVGKYPVPPDGDRIGEMKKDFRLMKEMGFNHIRIASIGIARLDQNGNFVLDTPFVDEMLKEAERQDISISVRIEGYSVNLRDFKDVLMIDQNGNRQDTSVWSDFIQTTLCHEGILQDNVLYAEKKAEYYKNFKSVVAFQIFNEPHMPGKTFFDYHPTSVAAYRKWLVKKGIMDKTAAENYTPPKARNEQSPEMWAYWRLFNRDALTNFLNNAFDGSKRGSTLPAFTCSTTDDLCYYSSYRGTDCFANAKKMDIVGYTNYCHACGAEFYANEIKLVMLVNAAEVNNKECWCIEVDSRTTIPPSLFNKNTFSALGSGAKGLVFYQWRGDYPSEATPIPNGCGLVNYDGSKTKNYDNAANMIKLLRDVSDTFVESKPLNEHIGILKSDFAAAYCDARENIGLKLNDRLNNEYVEQINILYSDLRKLGFTVKIVDAEALDNNAFDLDYLFVPTKHALEQSETAAVERFMKKGKKAYELLRAVYSAGTSGYIEFGKITNRRMQKRNYEDLLLTAEEIFILDGKIPAFKTDNRLVAVEAVESLNTKSLVLTNLTVNSLPLDVTVTAAHSFTTAAVYEVGKPVLELPVKENKFTVTGLKDGAVVILK